MNPLLAALGWGGLAAGAGVRAAHAVWPRWAGAGCVAWAGGACGVAALGWGGLGGRCGLGRPRCPKRRLILAEKSAYTCTTIQKAAPAHRLAALGKQRPQLPWK